MTDLYLISALRQVISKNGNHQAHQESRRNPNDVPQIGYLRREQAQTAINMLEVPKDPLDNPKEIDKENPTKWRTVKLPSEIEHLTTNRNCGHFGQAGGPWLESPLSQEVDFMASPVTSELILEGEYNASELDKITQLMIKHLGICDRSAAPLPLFITDNEFVSKLKNWNEKTTTSPSSLHLGHWKALLARHDQSHDPTSEACKELDAMQLDIHRARLPLIDEVSHTTVGRTSSM